MLALLEEAQHLRFAVAQKVGGREMSKKVNKLRVKVDRLQKQVEFLQNAIQFAIKHRRGDFQRLDVSQKWKGLERIVQ